MKNYYIEINGHQSEALSLDELKQKNITKETLVWYEGLQDWVKAGSVAELESIFKGIPPPIVKSVPPVLPSNETIYERNDSFFSRNKFLIGGFTLVLLIVLFVSFTDTSKNELETKTRENTYELEQQQRLLEVQNAKIVEQERLERERQERERVEAIQQRITGLSESLAVANKNFETAKRQLNDATSFQLLRSRDERNEQINNATENVERFRKEVEELEGEIERLKLEI